MRNPKWHRDEIILALDLYFSPDRGSIDSSNPKIIAVSELLNKLPLFQDRPDKEKFRNANGVTLKLSNFKFFDPDYTGKGMSGGSELDEIIFNEFKSDKEQLRKIASEIKIIAEDPALRNLLLTVEEDEQIKEDNVIEGQIIYKLHKARERNKKIVQAKKQQVLKTAGKLACEVCEFVFEDHYGEMGRGFIECHHRTPLSQLTSATITKMQDLALVCSNCHKMLHRSINTYDVSYLKQILSLNKKV